MKKSSVGRYRCLAGGPRVLRKKSGTKNQSKNRRRAGQKRTIKGN